MTTSSENNPSHSPELLRKSLEELRGIAKGLMADQELSDGEIYYLSQWLESHYSVTSAFPGNVIHDRIKEVLADGVIDEAERSHLVDTLNMLIEDRLDELTDQVDLTELWFDEVGLIEFDNTKFCLTGNFVYGPREVCQTAIEDRGGIVSQSVDTAAEFLVIGGLGVDEWRSGGLGVEIETAMRLRGTGTPLKIIAEGSWVTQLDREVHI
jgi:NAD-dependent DNA ligase